MSIEEQHVALPRLCGAPAYQRPPAPVTRAERPFNPDDLPIEAVQTEEERDLVRALPARAYAPGGGVVLHAQERRTNGQDGPHELRPQPFRLKELAGRLLGRDN